jgi:hypothetical protein
MRIRLRLSQIWRLENMIPRNHPTDGRPRRRARDQRPSGKGNEQSLRAMAASTDVCHLRASRRSVLPLAHASSHGSNVEMTCRMRLRQDGGIMPARRPEQRPDLDHETGRIAR